MTTPVEKTPLSEQQARSLAHWWGGTYQTTSPAPGEHLIRHGVAVPPPSLDAKTFIWVFSLEEAIEMENQRGFQDACSPDWVG
jgi:hypothetical protein